MTITQVDTISEALEYPKFFILIMLCYETELCIYVQWYEHKVYFQKRHTIPKLRNNSSLRNLGTVYVLIMMPI